MLKPQDIAVAFCLVLRREQRWTIADIGEKVHLSGSETHAAVGRLRLAGLYDPEDRQVRVRALRELLVHGVRHVYYPEWRPRCRGVPTAWSAPACRGALVVAPEGAVVWPHPRGEVIGDGLEPLYHTLPDAALDDPELYAALALVDLLRIGHARDVRMATSLLDERLAR